MRVCVCEGLVLYTCMDQPIVPVRTFMPVCFLCPTLLSGSVENLDVFQLYTNASPELHSICSVVFAASLNGAIGMSPK